MFPGRPRVIRLCDRCEGRLPPRAPDRTLALMEIAELPL